MNIQEAKEEIKNTLQAYLKKREDGTYAFPLLRQRPILLMGPPGIGKTAIMEQIARECQVGLVAYTITHHTRQSAIGLPQVRTKTFDGRSVDVTEYTMSEIIASVYDCMEKTGHREGILFIDEINCASETLAPIMLQFLQNKTFGNHRVPEGWIIAAAGNPPEYNKSVREFDIVTLDRVRQIDIAADVKVWLDYAVEKEIHGAVISFLSLKPDCFYQIINTPQEKSFVTARGWEDLSEIIKSYEEIGAPVGEALMKQYLQNESIARDFAVYYRLYCKYGTDYGIEKILQGQISHKAYEEKRKMAVNGGFEERFTVVYLILDYLNVHFAEYTEIDARISLLYDTLIGVKSKLNGDGSWQVLEETIAQKKHSFEVLQNMGMMDGKNVLRETWIIRRLEEYLAKIKEEHCRKDDQICEMLKQCFEKDKNVREKAIKNLQGCLENAFAFVEDCYKDGQEMVLFASGLVRNKNAVRFFSAHGCDAFLEKSSIFLYREQEKVLIEQCQDLM